MQSKRTEKIDSRIEREMEDLVTDLRSTLVTRRLKAVKSLGRLKTPMAVDPLKEVLLDRSREVRCAVIEALGMINPPGVESILIPQAADRSADVRLRVAIALGKCNSEDAINGLFDLLRDPKDDVAAMAAKALARHPSASLARLMRLFGEKSWKMRSRAAMAIARMGRKPIDALLAGLEDTDPNVRFWSALCLGRLKDKTHTRELLAKLTDPTTGVRIAALRALREVGDPSIVSKLFEALSQPSEQVRDLIYDILKDFGNHSIPFLMESLSSEFWMGRSLAARALSEMGSDAIHPLTQALESQDKERRFWAIKILSRMRERAVLPEIRKFLSDSDSEIRMAAVQGMGDLGDPESIPLLIERFLDPSWVVRREAHRSVVRFGDRAVANLIKALESIDEDVRYWSLRSIAEIKPPGLFPILVKLLKDRSWNVRKTTAEALSAYGEDALLELTNLATEGDSEVRYWVLQALGKIGSQISLPLLFRALEDSSEAIRISAQKALANFGASILDDLIALLKSDKRRLLESVAGTLQLMPPHIALPKLCQSLGKFDEHISYWIRRALAGFGPAGRKAVEPLLESKANEIRRQAIFAFGQVGLPEDAEIIIRHLKDEFWPARIAAAEVLGKLRNPLAVEPLMEALEDDDEDLAIAAVRSLGVLEDDRAVPALLSTLWRESWTLKYTVIDILGRMKVRRAVPELLRMLDEDTLDLRIPLIRALGNIGHPDSFKPLQERFLRETEPECRLAFIEAFGTLQKPEIIPTLMGLLKEERPWDEKRLLIRTLGQLRAMEARDQLIAFLRDPDLFISREALLALKNILPPEEGAALENRLVAARRRQEKFQQHFREGMRQMRLGAMVEAERELKNALKLNPRAAYVYSALGNLYYKTGKLIDATKAYVMAVQVEPRDVTLRLNLGMVYYRRRAYRESLEVFNAIAKMVDPKSQQGQYTTRMIERIQVEAKHGPTSRP